jgi:hypothetical protein
MDNNLHSRLCIEISSMARAAGQEIAQKIYAADLYAYVMTLQSGGKNAIFLHAFLGTGNAYFFSYLNERICR